MTLPVPADPVPGPIDANNWYAWDIALRYAQYQSDQTYRTNYLAAMKANTDALNAQAAAINAAAGAQRDAITALIAQDKAATDYTDSDLTRIFMSALACDWGMSGRGGASMLSTAQAMVAAYRAKFPATP